MSYCSDGVVLVVVKAHLDVVAGLEEILPVQVADQHLLVAVRHAVQPAVGVLFEHGEVRRVELIAIGIERAEQAQPRLLIEKDEPAEIAIEGLDAGARRKKVEVAAQIRDLGLDECFLQSDVRIQARRARAHIRTDDAVLAHLQIVDVDLRREPDLPVDGPIGRVAVKQSRRKGKVLAVGELAHAAEEFGAIGIVGAHAAGNGQACGPVTAVSLTRLRFKNVRCPKIG